MEPLPEEQEEQRFHRVDSLPEPGLTSASSSQSSIPSAEDSRSTTSSGDISGASGSSSEILTAEAVVLRLLEPAPTGQELDLTVTARKNCVGMNNKGVTWGFTSVIGRRREMEDAIAVIPAFMSHKCDHVGGCTAHGSRTSAEISPIHFFGVYDGHGGSRVAKFCAERMHGVLAEEWDREVVGSSGWQRRWEVAFSSSFERADNEVLTAAVAPEMVGSTAVVVVLSGCQIITSNCGDSRTVLCRGTETIPLTVDQKPDRQDELLRIEREGGRVINWNGARVFGVLAMSRAIGFSMSRWQLKKVIVILLLAGEKSRCYYFL
ncbi:protein phosphatase 2C 56-like isoform X2 [Durio zibethinus]|uniref:protein-serine/threonine phosphatase n=1 Tax=Durio zibethinus TaxID=66656 RepID=A0A6P5XPN3_DURZI|nr:protein phosphatase 2C 56-like isoform X2 [Durio zibethinus]